MQTDIQKAQHTHPNFIHGGVRFNLQAGNWKQLKIKTGNQFQSGFFNSQDQSYAIVKKSLFTFGPSSSNPSQGTLYSYNIVTEQTKQWHLDKQANTPMLRQNYGLVNYDGRLCMFGGRRQNQYFNDLISFCSYTTVWMPVIKGANPLLPSPRIPFIFTSIGNGYLFLLGGINGREVLKDAFILNDLSWRPLKFGESNQTQQTLTNLQQIVSLQGISYAFAKNNIYLFGGVNGSKYSNQLYKIDIDPQNLILSISKILIDSGPRPCARAYLCMERLGQTCFAIYGGTNGKALRDLTIYDLNENKWIEVYPLTGPLPALSKAKILYEYNSLFIIGEEIEKNHLGKCIVEIFFPEFELVKSQICSNCVRRLDMKEKEQVNGPKKPFVSNGLIYNMAIQINFPFQAFALLIDCASALNATEISIKSEETKDKLTYLDMRFNGKPLNREQFSSIVSHSYKEDPVVLQIIDKIKLGAMRLGKTLMYISIEGNLRRVFLFSADSLIISHYDELYGYYSYEQRINDEWLATQESIMHKKHIINLLKSYFDNPFLIINSVANHCLLIFENNVIMTSEKVYYGQLISTSNDINLCKNSKKVQFLDNIGFSLSDDPEVSLVNYLQYLFLNSKIESIQVQNKLIGLKHNKYLQQLQTLQSNGKIKQIYRNTLTLKEVQAECTLYEVNDPSVYIKQLRGVLMYFRGRLVNRFEINFGDLFWQKFYKTRYRKSFGLWTHVGVINFIRGVDVKSLGNEFKNENHFNYFMRHVKKEILYKLPTSRNEIIIIEGDESKNGKPEKKVKQ